MARKMSAWTGIGILLIPNEGPAPIGVEHGWYKATCTVNNVQRLLWLGKDDYKIDCILISSC